MILLKNCYHIATFNENGDEFKGYDVLIENNLIKEIAPSIELDPIQDSKTEVIDCSDHLVIPGLVNTHHHLYQTLTRNLAGAQNSKLFDWLVYLYPIWAKLDADAVYYSTMLGSVELLLTGCTTTTDHLYLYPQDFDGDIMGLQFAAAEKTGIRFAPTRGSMTRGRSNGGLPPDSCVQSVDEVMNDMVRVVEEFHDPSDFSMRRVIFAPCSPFSVEENVMIETAKLARKMNVLLHTHLAETEDEEEYCLTNHNLRPLALMDSWGWSGRDVFFAHGIWFNDEELQFLKETGTGVAHCPASNMRLGSGIARIKEMLNMGVRVGLAVDGSASNDASDMIGEARNAMLLQRVKYGADALSARDTLKFAIQGGADLLGFNKIGSIKPGMAADLAIFNMKKLQYAGALSDPVAALLFTGFDHRTDYTIVNGKVCVRNGHPVGIDEEALFVKANSISEKMCKNI